MVTGDTGLPDASDLGLSQLVHLARVGSTMDEAHTLAEQGAPGGTCVLADEQTAGRGRGGNRWQSAPHRGVWLTLIERPASADGLDVLSIRLGLAIAHVLESIDSVAHYQVKWPNDLFRDGRKIAGVLAEARWREQTLEWIAIGVGVNLHADDDDVPVGRVPRGVTRNSVLRLLLPALREAVTVHRELTDQELDDWHRRDLAMGRRLVAPERGVAQGITSSGSLRVLLDRDGLTHLFRSGSLRLAD